MSDATHFIRFFSVCRLNHNSCAEKKTSTKKSCDSRHQKFKQGFKIRCIFHAISIKYHLMLAKLQVHFYNELRLVFLSVARSRRKLAQIDDCDSSQNRTIKRDSHELKRIISLFAAKNERNTSKIFICKSLHRRCNNFWTTGSETSPRCSPGNGPLGLANI